VPIYKVIVSRETVDELEFLVEAPSLQVLPSHIDDDLYIAADAILGLRAWKTVENDIDITLEEVETTKPPLLVFDKDAKEGEDMFKIYEPPTVDPRQLSLPGTENE